MRYSTKVRLRRNIIVGLSALAFISLNVWLFIYISLPNRALSKKVVELPIVSTGQVYAYEDGMVMVSDQTLISYNYEDGIELTMQLPVSNMKAARRGNIICVWESSSLQVYNEQGKEITSITVNGEIFMVSISTSMVAVATIEEGQYWVRVYNLAGQQIHDMLLPFMSVLDIGFFGDNMSQLWVLSLDSHGTIPITQIRTHHPGKSMTGLISINNQICYKVFPMKDVIYTVSTNHIQTWKYTNERATEQLVYGWTLQDYNIRGDQGIDFLMGPATSEDSEVPVSALWYLGAGTEQYRVSMPGNIFRAMLFDKKIYAVSSDGVYVMDTDGSARKFHKMPFGVGSVVAVIPNKGFVLRSHDDRFPGSGRKAIA